MRHLQRQQLERAIEYGLDPAMQQSTAPCVKLPLGGDDCPNWISHIELTRQDDHILIEVVKTNGRSYGEASVGLDQFNNMADLLLTP